MPSVGTPGPRGSVEGPRGGLRDFMSGTREEGTRGALREREGNIGHYKREPGV
jgi:hypothetical protein